MSVQIMLLCGGKGERLRPLTENLPKSLVEISGKAILGHILDHIVSYDFKDIIVATGYKAERIQEYLKDNYSHLNIATSYSGDVDIIGRIKSSLKYVKGELILLYGDTLSDVDMKKLIDSHHGKKGQATVTLWPLQCQFGVMEIDAEGFVSTYKEKPQLDKWINIGYFYFDNKILQNLNEFNSFESFLTSLIDRKELNAYQHFGAHITVNTLKELQDAENNIDLIYKNKNG